MKDVKSSTTKMVQRRRKGEEYEVFKEGLKETKRKNG
jgi:hypothetical protein